MLRKMFYVSTLVVLTIVGIFCPAYLFPTSATAQATCQRFDPTGHTLCGRFLQYWQQHGGLAQQGYPVSEPFSEMSDTDGKLYTVQYFERAVFEMHPENRSPNDVLLSLLGRFQYKAKYPNGVPKRVPNTLSGSQQFPQTGKRLGGSFLTYWQSHGGLAQQGYPLSDEFLETSATDGKLYKVQYFERAVFEAHPEKSAPYDVLLSLLGSFRLRVKYGDGSSLPSAPRFLSGGLGLTRTQWESMHGKGVDYQLELGGGTLYEGGKYDIAYSGDTSASLIIELSVSLPPTTGIGDARADSRALLPVDAQPLALNQNQGDVGGALFDTYFSQWLSGIYPPGTLAYGEPPADIWLGSRPGTFTVLYYMSSDPNPTLGITIHPGTP